MTSNPIHKRSYITVSQINHKSNKTVTKNTDPATLFTNSGSCIMMPIVDQGPLCKSSRCVCVGELC